MKVKSFGKINTERNGLNVLNLENEINAWLDKNSDLKIIDIKQSSNGGSMQNTKLIFSIWYEKNKERKFDSANCNKSST